MNSNINEITINGIAYVRKDSVPALPNLSQDMVLVRCKSAGVFYGNKRSVNLPDGIAVLNNARRVWYWAGAATLSQLAMEGTTKPDECKFPEAVPEIALTEVIEVIPMTETAVKSLNSVKVWKQ